MRGANSAPTARVLDVVELLCHASPSGHAILGCGARLDLSQATAHSILKTLSDRGWVRRDPVTRQFALGPALTVMAAHLDIARPLAAMARDAVQRFADMTGMPASLLERSGDELVITPFENGKSSSITAAPNQRIPYMPPFGIAFAAWDAADEREAWIARGAAGEARLQQRLRTLLTRTRERGYDVDWMTPALSKQPKQLERSPETRSFTTCVPSSSSCVWNSPRPTRCRMKAPAAHTQSPQFLHRYSMPTTASPSFSPYIPCEP